MHNIICTVCPRGCHLKVDKQLNVTGNFCNRGIIYGKTELTNPTRIITSTIPIKSSLISRLSVKTDLPIPKNKIFAVMEEINKLRVVAPIKAKDIILENVLSLGINIVATRSIDC